DKVPAQISRMCQGRALEKAGVVEGGRTLMNWFALGLLLGARHALEADHIVAVTSMSSRLRSAAAGVLWGLGHTISMGVIVVLITVLGIEVPPVWMAFTERVIGVSIVLLGVWCFFAVRELHTHPHSHGASHSDIHPHS